MNDEQLVELAKQGDQKSLSDLVKKYESTIFNFSYKMCRNKDKAEHTMQETFLSMIKNLHNFKGDSKISTWLYKIVSNNCLMLARKESRFNFQSIDDEQLELPPLHDEKITPDVAAENSEIKEMLDQAVMQLEPHYRIVFLLRDVEGLSAEETAQILNISIPAVKSRLHRARAFIKQQLNEKL
jgi:RNA polymerase sigma-70 factor, ECF subfamily